MPAYTTKEDMIDLYSDLGVTLRADDDDDGVIGRDEERYLERAIRYATTKIQEYLLQYDMQALESSQWVREKATWMACYSHSRRRGNAAQFKEEHDEAIMSLERIRDGLGIVPDAVPCFDINLPHMSSYVVDLWHLGNKQRVQGSISVGRDHDQARDQIVRGPMTYPQGLAFTESLRETPDGDIRIDGDGNEREVESGWVCPRGQDTPGDTTLYGNVTTSAFDLIYQDASAGNSNMDWYEVSLSYEDAVATPSSNVAAGFVGLEGEDATAGQTEYVPAGDIALVYQDPLGATV